MKKVLLLMAVSLSLLLILTYWVLRNTPEYHIHNMRGANNTVYLDSDGHSEYAYDSRNEIVDDCVNTGSYNYAHPVKQPFLHFYQDTLPWLMWGTCKEDPTSTNERVAAYLKDLALGAKVSFGIR